MTTTKAQELEARGATLAEIDAVASWNPDDAVWEFPDGSAGNFTDLEGGAAIRTLTGEPVLRFRAVGPR